MNPICVKCGHTMTRELSGVLVADLYMQNKEIYKLWYADFFRCPICRAEIIHDFAEKPFWECHEEGRGGQKTDAIIRAKNELKYFEVKET